MRPPRLAAVGALGLLTAACTSGASPGGQNGNSSGLISINVWYYNESGPDVRFMHAVDQTFEKLHHNITLNLTVYPEGNYTTKVDTALAVNSVPDIGDMYQRQWIKAGKFLPLNAAIQQ